MNLEIHRRLSAMERDSAPPTSGPEWISQTFERYKAMCEAEPGSREAAIAEAEYLKIDPRREFESFAPIVEKRLIESRKNEAENDRLAKLAIACGLWPEDC